MIAYPIQKTLAIAMLAFLLVGCQKSPDQPIIASPSESAMPSFLVDEASVSPIVNEVSEDGVINVVVDTPPEEDTGIIMPSETPPPSVQNTEDFLYKDSTASFTAVYSSPAGEESIGIVIAVKDDKISGIKVEPNSQNNVSKGLQTAFSNEIAGVIVGKKLHEISDLSRVGGASLTTSGFNKEFEKIKEHFKK
jgi:hypothetical protein